MTRVFCVRWELHEPMLFVSRELGSLYQTEPLIGHYAQVYALGLATSRYGLEAEQTHGPSYSKDLRPMAEAGLYLTPARPVGVVRTRFERFNVLGEGLRSRMDQGVVVDSLDLLLTNGVKGRAINRPQQGVWQFVERGMCFESFLVCDTEQPEIPAWTRIGKTSAKAKISVTEGEITGQETGVFESVAWLCALDLPDDVIALGFELFAIPPVPILGTPRLSGRYLVTSYGPIPADLRFRFS